MNTAKKGFTLAEVLITLTIVGIIASLIIPMITAYIDNTKRTNIFKQVYSDMSQATTSVRDDNGGSFMNICGYWQYTCLYNKYKPYLNVVKTCTDAQAEGCWHQSGQWQYNNGNVCNTYADCAVSGYDAPKHPGGVVFPSGALVLIIMYDNNCAVGGACGEFLVDVNGFTGPNQVSKDIAAIFIQPDKVTPDTRNIDLGLTAGYLLSK